MGVTNLWNILAPVKRHTPLTAMHGQTVAVDLSIWVCENQCVKSMQGVVSRPYLRNLFFRVSHLTQLGVRLVFVIEGAAPQLKWGEMKRRQQALGRGGARAGKGGRGNFNSKLRECCQLLDMLGVPYIHSRGEAEAMCAALNAAGLVDACITDDGDAFLYGARTVYRNFTMNNKDPHVESYCMDTIEDDLGISRQTLVGVALLLGCDYLQGGVPGVGVDRVIKYLDSIKGVDLLQRFEAWQCMSSAQCVSKIEVLIQHKALAVSDFPQKQIISEFLTEQETVPKKSFVWRRPQLVMMQDYAETKMEWMCDYTTEKILPLITFWELSNPRANSSQCLKPHRIVKSRVRQGVPVYEVEWNKQSDDTRTSSEFYTTMEEQSLFTQIFPLFVSRWEEEVTAKKTKKKTTSRKTKKNIEEDNLASQLETLNLEQGQTESSSALSQTCSKKKQIGEEVSHGKGRRKVNRKVAADPPTGVLGAVQTSWDQQPEVDTNTAPTAASHRKPSHRQKTAVSGTVKTKLRKQDEQIQHLKCQTIPNGRSEEGHPSLGLSDDSCFGHDNTLLSALPGIEKSRLECSESDLRKDRPEECNVVHIDDCAESVWRETGGPMDEESDSDKENDAVFLTLTERLQMKLGQTAKSKSVSNGFEACLALKKTQTISKSESSLQGRKGRKVRDAVCKESGTLGDEPEATLNMEMVKTRPQVHSSVQESKLQGEKENRTEEQTHDNQPSNLTHETLELKRETPSIDSVQAASVQPTVPNTKIHLDEYISVGYTADVEELSEAEDVLYDGMNQDPILGSPPINSKHLPRNSNEPSTLMSSASSTHDFTYVANMMTAVNTPKDVSKSAVICQDETFGFKDLHEDFSAALSDLDKKQISSTSAGYCNLVNRLKEKLKQPLDSRYKVLPTSSSPGESNLSVSELPQSPSFLCSQTILSGNDDCFLEPEVTVPHQAPALVRCARSCSDTDQSKHHASPTSYQASKQDSSVRTRSETSQQVVPVVTTSSMVESVMMESGNPLQGNTMLLEESTLLQEHGNRLTTNLQGNSRLLCDDSVLQASTMLQEDRTLLQQTSFKDATLQFGHFSMQASLLNDLSSTSILGGNSILMSETMNDATKTVLMSETGNVLNRDGTSILMSETVVAQEQEYSSDDLLETEEVIDEGNPSTILLSNTAGLRCNGASAICSEHLILEETLALNDPSTNRNPCGPSDSKQSPSVSPSYVTSLVTDVHSEDCNQDVPVVDNVVSHGDEDADLSVVVPRNLRGGVDVSVDDLNLSIASLSIHSKKPPEDSSPSVKNINSVDLELSGNGSYVFSTVVKSGVSEHKVEKLSEADDFSQNGRKDASGTKCVNNRRSKLSLRKSSSNLCLEKSVGCGSRTDVAPVSEQPSGGLSSEGANSKADSCVPLPMRPDIIDLTSGSPTAAGELTHEVPETSSVNDNKSSICMSRNIFRDPNAKAAHPKPKTRIKSWTSRKQALFRLLEDMSDSDTDSEIDGFSKTQTKKLSQGTEIPNQHTHPASRTEYRITAEDFNTFRRQGYMTSLKHFHSSNVTTVASQYKRNDECPTGNTPEDNMTLISSHRPCGDTRGIKSVDDLSKEMKRETRVAGNSTSISNSTSSTCNSTSSKSTSTYSTSTSSKSTSSNSTSSNSMSSKSTSSNSTLSNTRTSNSKSSLNSTSSSQGTANAVETDPVVDIRSNKTRTNADTEDSVLNTTAHESPISLTDRLRSRLSNNARVALKTLSSQRRVVSSANIKPINK